MKGKYLYQKGKNLSSFFFIWIFQFPIFSFVVLFLFLHFHVGWRNFSFGSEIEKRYYAKSKWIWMKIYGFMRHIFAIRKTTVPTNKQFTDFLIFSLFQFSHLRKNKKKIIDVFLWDKKAFCLNFKDTLLIKHFLLRSIVSLIIL